MRSLPPNRWTRWWANVCFDRFAGAPQCLSTIFRLPSLSVAETKWMSIANLPACICVLQPSRRRMGATAIAFACAICKAITFSRRKFQERIKLVFSSMMKRIIPALLCALLAIPVMAAKKKPKDATKSALDAYVKDATQRDAVQEGNSSGSLWSPSSRLADLGRDLRASQVDDLVTIVVAENASAV